MRNGANIVNEINTPTTVVLLSVLVALVLERIRRNFPRFHGDLVTAVAWILGAALAAWWDLRVAAEYGFPGVPAPLDYVVTGGIIAGVAGIVGEGKQAMRRSPTIIDVTIDDDPPAP